MEQRASILDIPLFPLSRVLFPGMALPLHIFEERYKRMIALCLEQRRSFGVVLIRSGPAIGGEAVPYEVGTVARIVEAIPLADGQYNIMTQGAARFQVLESRYQAGYLTARVELLEEEEHDQRHLAELEAAVQERFVAFIEDLAALTEAKLEPIRYPAGPTATSYFVAAHLPLDEWEKQRLLEASSTDVRLTELRRILGRERALLERFGKAQPPYLTGPDERGRLLFSPN